MIKKEILNTSTAKNTKATSFQIQNWSSRFVFASYLNKSLRKTIKLICRVNLYAVLVGAVAALYLMKIKEILNPT